MVSASLHPLIRDLDFETCQYYNEVEVWCVNDQYPPILEIDARLINYYTPFKFIDLAEMLPEGMWLHRKYDSMIQMAIISMTENYNHILASTIFPLDDQTNKVVDNTEKVQVVMQRDEEIKKEIKEKTSKKKVVSMPFTAVSAKKLLSLKSEGADKKSFLSALKKGPGSDKKDKKGKK